MPRTWSATNDAYYLELAFHGDLKELKLRYQAQQKYLPEYFLWHLFHNFARMALMMKHYKYRWMGDSGTEINGKTYEYGDYLPSAFLLHGDISPANVFMTNSHADWYTAPHGDDLPSVRLGDFGVSRVVLDKHSSSAKRMLQGGTYVY
jgi:serine/threonine protein kinase